MSGYGEFGCWITAFALSATRIGAALLICPAFSEGMISGLARRLVILSFAFLVVPVVQRTMPAVGVSWALLALLAVKEALIGFLIGFFSAIPFWVAENVGNLIDNQRGATMGEVYSPLSGAQVSTTGIFFTQVVTTVFFVSGAVLLMLGALYASYTLWPVFGDWVTFHPHAPEKVLGALDGMLKTTVVISAPVVILMFLATIGLGFVNRTAPQLNVFFLSMPVKSALGVAMLVIYLPFVIDRLMYTKESDILAPVRLLIGGTT